MNDELDVMSKRVAEIFLDLAERLETPSDGNLAQVDTMLRAANTYAQLVIASKLRNGTIDVDIPEGVSATAMNIPG